MPVTDLDFEQNELTLLEPVSPNFDQMLKLT